MKIKMYKTLTPKLFDLEDKENWKQHLEEEGYVVLKDMITNQEIDEAIALFEEEWKVVAPEFSLTDQSTWLCKNMPIVWSKGSVMWNGLAQGEFMWKLRRLETLKRAYMYIYGEPLAVSLDGYGVFVSKDQKSPKWLHQDQHAANPSYSVQGLLNLLEVGEHDAGFVCVPRSHKTYVHKGETLAKKKNWVLIPDSDPHQEKAVKLLIPKGCYTLWSSRTVHANVGISKEKKLTGINRLSAYITFAPKSWQTPKAIKKRQQIYRQGKAANHWVDERCAVKTFPFAGIKKYKSRQLFNIFPRINENGEIPKEYLELI